MAASASLTYTPADQPEASLEENDSQRDRPCVLSPLKLQIYDTYHLVDYHRGNCRWHSGIVGAGNAESGLLEGGIAWHCRLDHRWLDRARFFQTGAGIVISSGRLFHVAHLRGRTAFDLGQICRGARLTF